MTCDSVTSGDLYPCQPEPGGRQVRQLDLAPTLAALLAVPVPAESVGRLIQEAVRPLGLRRLATALINNGRQLLRLCRETPHSAGTGEPQSQRPLPGILRHSP